MVLNGLGACFTDVRSRQGGHFAALEVPELLWKDVQDFISEFWDKSG